MASRKPCGKDIGSGQTCPHERAPGLQQCRWHWLLKQSAMEQRRWAEWRLNKAKGENIARVRSEDWPEGMRWCSGCQAFVPFFYVQGSRCKSCDSRASHGSRIEKLYGITEETYEAMERLQGGRCYICHRKSVAKRLAVDHDHRTGKVRGLLCAAQEMGCNLQVLGTLATATDDILSAARRVVEYLEDPPYDRVMREFVEQPPEQYAIAGDFTEMVLDEPAATPLPDWW